jgi:hypothetical protein
VRWRDLLLCTESEALSEVTQLNYIKTQSCGKLPCPIFYAFDLLYLNDRDLRQLPLINRKEKLRALIERSGLTDVICGKYVEGRGVDLYEEVCERNLEGIVAKRKGGKYPTVSGWLKIKNPNYSQSERRHDLFESLKAKQTRKRQLPPILKKPPLRAVPIRGTQKRGQRRSVARISD